MRSGKLDTRITIQQNTNPGTADADGQVVAVWSELAVVWAEIKPVKTMEKFIGDQLLAQADFVLQLRYRDGLDPSMRIVIDSNIFEIIGITEIRRKKGLFVPVKQNVK